MRGAAADVAPVLEWKQPVTKQTNPPPTAKTTDQKAAVVLDKGHCDGHRYAATNAGPKIFITFDTSEKANKNQRIVTCFNTEELMFERHVVNDDRLLDLEDTSPDALGGSQAVFASSSLFVLGGAGPTQAMLKINAVSFESEVIPFDEAAPLNIDWNHALVGTIGDQLWVLCEEVGWDTACVIDLAGVAPAAPDAAPAAEQEAQPEETSAEEAAEEAAPAADEETNSEPVVSEGSKWQRIPLEAGAPGACERGKRSGVFLDDEVWLLTSTDQGLSVHLLSTGARLRQLAAQSSGASDDPEESAQCLEIQQLMQTQGRSHWIQPPVHGAAPPPLTHFNVSLVGRQLWVLGGRLLQNSTAAFKGDGCEYESGYDYAYVLDTDRCEWSVRHLHGSIPHSPSSPVVVAYEADVWLLYPTVTSSTWWWGGVPQIPEDYQPDKGAKCTKFGGIQSCYMLPKAVYPLQPQQPPQGATSLGLWRTWAKPDQPILWKELEPRDYLNKTVWPAVLQGLQLVEKSRPNNPVRALAMHLLTHQHKNTA